jgi:hypothetical protein
MPIERHTPEIDNTFDARSSTGAEIQKRPAGADLEMNRTRSVEAYRDAEISKTDDLSPHRPTVGRTLGDIVVEFKNDRRFMTIVLTIISFGIFVSKLDSISSFQLPLILALLLNLIWHSFPYIEKKLAGSRSGK